MTSTSSDRTTPLHDWIHLNLIRQYFEFLIQFQRRKKPELPGNKSDWNLWLCVSECTIFFISWFYQFPRFRSLFLKQLLTSPCSITCASSYTVILTDLSCQTNQLSSWRAFIISWKWNEYFSLFSSFFLTFWWSFPVFFGTDDMNKMLVSTSFKCFMLDPLTRSNSSRFWKNGITVGPWDDMVYRCPIISMSWCQFANTSRWLIRWVAFFNIWKCSSVRDRRGGAYIIKFIWSLDGIIVLIQNIQFPEASVTANNHMVWCVSFFFFCNKWNLSVCHNVQMQLH